MGYLEKARGSQTEEQRHRTFSNLVLKGKLRKAVWFVCDRENGGVLQPYELAEDRTGTINKIVTSVLEGRHPSKTITSCATLDTYKETPIFITVDITKEAGESVAWKRSGSSGPVSTDSEAL